MIRLLLVILATLCACLSSARAQDKPEVFPQLGHSGWVKSVVFSPDGRVLASGSEDHTIKLWDVASGRELRTLSAHSDTVSSVAFSPDGRALASGSWDDTIKLWDVASGRELRTLGGHSNSVRSVAFSPDGRVLASGSWDRTIKLWDVASGRELHTLSGHSEGIESVAFSPDGRVLASGSWDHTIKLWDVASGRELRTLRAHSNYVESVAFSPDGRMLASGSNDYTIKLWDVASGRELRTLSGHSDEVHSVLFSPDGRTLASGNDDHTIKLWDVASGRELRTLSGHSKGVESVAFSPDGRVLASGNDDHTIKLWDVASGRELRTLSGHSDVVSSVAFSPDGRVLASGSWDHTIKLWDMASGREPRTLSGHSEGVDSVAFSPDGRVLASGSGDGTIKLWDVASGRELRTLGHSNVIESVTFSPDGRVLASGTDNDTIKMWDLASGRELPALSGHSNGVFVASVAFSPDGRVLASGSDDYTIKLWDVASGRELHTLSGHSGRVSSVAFSPDGRVLASGSVDQTIKLWDVASARELHTLSGHSSWVYSVAFSPDGRWLASGGSNGTIRIWDASSGNAKVSFVNFTDGSYLAITPEGYYDASSATAEDNLNVRIGNRVFPVGAYRKEFYRPDLVKLSLAGQSLKELGFAGIDSVKLAPIVELVDLPSTTSERKLTVNVRITDGGGGLGQVRLWLNGTAVAAQQPSPGSAPISVTFTVQLPSGPNGVQAEADNAAGTMHANSAMHQIIATLPPAPHGKLYALLVGIKEFKNPQLNNLKYPVADAHLLAETLEKYSAPLFQEKPNITLLTTPEQTTRDSLIHALKTIKTVIGPDDVFVFYVASHGDIVDGKYFLATSNVESGDGFAAQALSEDDLTSLLADIPAPKKLILVDTCHTPVGDDAQGTVRSRGYNDKTAVKKMGREIGVTVLGAATTNQEAIEEDADGHGLFTFVVADGLSGSARVSDGMVTNLALIDYVADVVSRLAKERYNHEQNPPVDVNGERFPLTKVR